jgi:hypothetical protein
MTPMKSSSSRCKANTKGGRPCRAAATEGGLCFFHANPNKAAEFGRIGGRKNGHDRSEVKTSLPALDTTVEVKETVTRLIEDLYSGKLHPRVASGLASLLTSNSVCSRPPPLSGESLSWKSSLRSSQPSQKTATAVVKESFRKP